MALPYTQVKPSPYLGKQHYISHGNIYEYLTIIKIIKKQLTKQIYKKHRN